MITVEQLAFRSVHDYLRVWSGVRTRVDARRPRRKPGPMLGALIAMAAMAEMPRKSKR